MRKFKTASHFPFLFLSLIQTILAIHRLHIGSAAKPRQKHSGLQPHHHHAECSLGASYRAGPTVPGGLCSSDRYQTLSVGEFSSPEWREVNTASLGVKQQKYDVVICSAQSFKILLLSAELKVCSTYQ